MTDIKRPCVGSIASAQDNNTPENRPIAAGLQGRLALKPKEAAQLIGVGNNTIYQLCHREDFPAIKVGAGIIIPVDGLLRWLDQQAGREMLI